MSAWGLEAQEEMPGSIAPLKSVKAWAESVPWQGSVAQLGRMSPEQHLSCQSRDHPAASAAGIVERLLSGAARSRLPLLSAPDSSGRQAVEQALLNHFLNIRADARVCELGFRKQPSKPTEQP